MCPLFVKASWRVDKTGLFSTTVIGQKADGKREDERQGEVRRNGWTYCYCEEKGVRRKW
jgi:hypothetical protein